MKTLEKQISIGDWVEIVNHRFLTRYSGFVTKISEVENAYKVKITRNNLGESITVSKSLWFIADEVIPYRSFHDEDDLLLLIDMALDIHDEAWFKELTDMLPLNNF